MTALLAIVLLWTGLFVASGLLYALALVITDTAHRLRGDIRCTAGCSCRGRIEG